MAHLLRRLGASALQIRKTVEGKVLPSLISREEAMTLREQFYRDGQQWPFESIVPGLPKPPPGAKQWSIRLKLKEERRAARQKEISEAMSKMPKLIEEYRALRRLDWSEVSAVDKLTLSTSQIKEKYIKRRLAKQ